MDGLVPLLLRVRHFAGSVGSHRASGDPAAAMKTMKQAVLYEAPWCDEKDVAIRVDDMAGVAQ